MTVSQCYYLPLLLLRDLNDRGTVLISGRSPYYRHLWASLFCSVFIAATTTFCDLTGLQYHQANWIFNGQGYSTEQKTRIWFYSAVTWWSLIQEWYKKWHRYILLKMFYYLVLYLFTYVRIFIFLFSNTVYQHRIATIKNYNRNTYFNYFVCSNFF